MGGYRRQLGHGCPLASVYTEMPTASGKGRGYIDVLVRIGGPALAIENKPDANDQPLPRYLDDLAHHCRDGHCLVYLSGSGDGPTAASIEPARVSREVEAGNLVLTGYPALIDWLEACMPVSRAPAVSAMLEGLVRHIGKRFMGTDDVKEQSDLIDLVTRDRDALEPALAIVEAGARSARAFWRVSWRRWQTRRAAEGGTSPAPISGRLDTARSPSASLPSPASDSVSRWIRPATAGSTIVLTASTA